MIKKIIGGVVVLVIGGTTFAVSKSDVVNNFANNTGLTKQQAQQYINNIPKSALESFDKIGRGYVSDGNSILNTVSSIDCADYTYQWETSSLSCSDGQDQLQTIGNDEVTLGDCYEALGTNLGNSAKSKINECISDIDTTDSDYTLPIAASLLDSKTLTDNQNTDAYNKSVLQAALDSK